MSITVSDPVDVEAEQPSALLLNQESAADIQPTWLRRWTARIALRARTILMSFAVWMLYVPHYSVLWLLGPRWGMAWVRFAARIHWLLTFVGAQRATRCRLEELAPLFRCGESVSEIMLKHLEMKHECFARVRVYGMQGGLDVEDEILWDVTPESRDAITRIEDRTGGLILVGFHFGCFQMSAVTSRLLPNCNPLQLRFRDAQCVENVASPIARLAVRKAMEADQRSGSQVFYVDAKTNLMPVLRLLREGGCAGVAADGMLAEEFVEVPFLDGYLRAPSGWARLATTTHSEVVVVTDRGITNGHNQMSLDDRIRCSDRSSETIRSAVAQSIQILGELIREQPWCWHPWQRLRSEKGPDGVPRYYLQQFSVTPRSALARRVDIASPHTTMPVESTNGHRRRSPRPKAAILCNSFTPYRIHLHERIVSEVPEVELWSLATHDNAYNRWKGVEAPKAIRPVNFGQGEPTNEQTLLKYSWREWRKGGRIIRWLREHRVSAVFCQGCGDVGRLRILRWCRCNGIPCFLTGDFNIRADKCRGPRRWVKQLVYGRAVAWSAGLLPCGSYGLALLQRYGGKSKPAFDFPFVPDLETFEHPPESLVQEVSQKLDLAPGRRRIVFSARLMRVKRPDLALKAFLAIAVERPEWDLVMLGDGELRAALEGSVPEPIRHRIHWTGFLHDRREVAAVYAVSDVLLLPSDHEPWGVVVVEAVAAGLAIVASDVVGAAPELIHHDRNGKLFAAGNLDQLTSVLRAATHPEAIDAFKSYSIEVLHEWLKVSDPVAGFRSAIELCESEPAFAARFGLTGRRRERQNFPLSSPQAS